MNTFSFFGWEYVFCFFLFSHGLQELNTEYKYDQCCTHLSQSDCEYLFKCCNGTRTHNHLACKRTLNHLTILTKWLGCVVSTNLYGAFDCMFLAKWLNFRLRTKWLWVRILLQLLKLQISQLFQAKSSLTFSQI